MSVSELLYDFLFSSRVVAACYSFDGPCSPAVSCLFHSKLCFFSHIFFFAFALLLFAPHILVHIVRVSLGYLLLNCHTDMASASSM